MRIINDGVDHAQEIYIPSPAKMRPHFVLPDARYDTVSYLIALPPYVILWHVREFATDARSTRVFSVCVLGTRNALPASRHRPRSASQHYLPADSIADEVAQSALPGAHDRPGAAEVPSVEACGQRAA